MKLYLKEEIEQFIIKRLDKDKLYSIEEIFEKYCEMEMDLDRVNEEMRDLILDRDDNWVQN